MRKQEAYQSFVYHGDRIYSPLGNYSEYHDRMRSLWAQAYKNGSYKRLPRDPVKADEMLAREIS